MFQIFAFSGPNPEGVATLVEELAADTQIADVLDRMRALIEQTRLAHSAEQRGGATSAILAAEPWLDPQAPAPAADVAPPPAEPVVDVTDRPADAEG